MESKLAWYHSSMSKVRKFLVRSWLWLAPCLAPEKTTYYSTPREASKKASRARVGPNGRTFFLTTRGGVAFFRDMITTESRDSARFAIWPFLALSAVLTSGVLLRFLFMTGPIGGDDVRYLELATTCFSFQRSP